LRNQLAHSSGLDATILFSIYHDLHQKVQEHKYARDTKEQALQRVKDTLQQAENDLQTAIKARTIIQEAATETQQNLKYHIESLVNEALRSIWGEQAYTFKANFVQRRNRVECDLRLVRDGNEIEPLFSTGGGVCDVVSIALRMVFHGLGKTIPVMIDDEPLRQLSRDMQEAAANVRNALCRQLGLQFIIITHEEDAILGADRVFRFTLVDGQTQVEVLSNE
jgi:ABC-type dipeptide/oligopeptide/nickel transport system ATPase subunit